MKTEHLDTNVWTTLSHGGAVPRRWLFVGRRRGADCRFEVRLGRRHPSLPNIYEATAVAAHNVHFLCRDHVRLDELEEIR